MGNHTGQSPQEVSIVRADTCSEGLEINRDCIRQAVAAVGWMLLGG
jgi:hypothetical protein